MYIHGLYLYFRITTTAAKKETDDETEEATNSTQGHKNLQLLADETEPEYRAIAWDRCSLYHTSERSRRLDFRKRWNIQLLFLNIQLLADETEPE